MVLLLLIRCLVGFCVWSLFCLALLVVFSGFVGVRAACFALVFFLVSCGCLCSVALPCGVVGLSAVCGCGVS